MSDTVTVEEAAQILQVDPRTIRNMIRRGSLPGAYRLDPNSPKSTYRIPRADVNRILQQRAGWTEEVK